MNNRKKVINNYHSPPFSALDQEHARRPMP